MKRNLLGGTDVPFSDPASFPEIRRLRGQEDVGVVDVSVVVACPESEDMARQEYRLSSDLAYQVQKFGAGLPFKSGEVNFDNLDLTVAFDLIAQSREAWLRLPRVVRDRYQSWNNVERAAASGELEQLLKTAGIDTGAVPGAKPAVSPSDSAAGGASAPSTAS